MGAVGEDEADDEERGSGMRGWIGERAMKRVSSRPLSTWLECTALYLLDACQIRFPKKTAQFENKHASKGVLEAGRAGKCLAYRI